MKICHPYAIPIALLALSGWSCVDSNYDLSDIDTTSRISVNDLVVPINIDEIYLSSVIDIDENDPNADIQIVNGQYAYVNHGDFKSTGISIPDVTIKSAKINPINVGLNLPINGTLPGIALPEFDVNLPSHVSTYSFSSENITEDICDLTQVNGDFNVNVHIDVSSLASIAQSFKFTDLKLQLPKGITFTSLSDGEYNINSGVLTLNKSINNASFTLVGKASGLSIPAGSFNEAMHSFSMKGDIGIIGGNLGVTTDKSGSATISSASLVLDFEFGDISVRSIDGAIKYNIGNVSVPDIDISNLPDVLSQPGTNLLLANPCLYLSVNNPVWESDVYARTGMQITSYHKDKSEDYSLDNGYFTIAAKPINTYCLSPSRPNGDNASYPDYEHVPFTQLSYVLSGDGLPDKLKVELTDPTLPRQDIKNFKIGHDYGEIRGTYEFVAPLAFKNGTHISYTDRLDGWSSEDLDAMTITKLEVAFTISTDVPIAITFTGYPLDKNGNRMQGVTIEPVQINANAQSQGVKVAVTGDIRNLDGMEFTATASATDGQALNPDMKIALKDVRPRVSGYYEKEL